MRCDQKKPGRSSGFALVIQWFHRCDPGFQKGQPKPNLSELGGRRGVEINGENVDAIDVADEVIVEADVADSDVVAERVERAMKKAAELFLRKIPVAVDVAVSEEWSH